MLPGRTASTRRSLLLEALLVYWLVRLSGFPIGRVDVLILSMVMVLPGVTWLRHDDPLTPSEANND